MNEFDLSAPLKDFLRASNLPFLIKSAERALDNRFFADDASLHNCFELLCIQSGKIALEFTDNSITAIKNDLIIIKPNVAHRVSVADQSVCQILVLKFDFLENSSVSSVAYNEFVGYLGDSDTGSFLLLKNHFKDQIISALANIFKEEAISDDASQFLRSIYTIELFVWLTRALRRMWEERLSFKGGGMEDLILSAKQFIQDNSHLDLSLNDIAAYVYLSPAHFSRVFKKINGVSPIQYLLAQRIENSKELLRYSSMKISDIALKVGFLNPQRFNEMFKKYQHCSPTDFRNCR